jgi:sulfite exporter TauE/SafE
MIPLALAVLGASLVGSLHCAAMCGGLVAVYAADPSPRARWRRVAAHVAYNGGRLVAYATLGAGAGAVGASTDLAAGLVGIGRLAAVVAGLFVLLWGVVGLLEALGVTTVRVATPGWIRRLIGRALMLVSRRDPVSRAAAIGLATGLMPCGWLYAFVVAAAGSASPLAGAGLMALFWLGTVPMMASLGIGIRVAGAPLRRHFPVVSAAAMIVVGVVTVYGRVAPTWMPPPSPEHSGARPVVERPVLEQRGAVGRDR